MQHDLTLSRMDQLQTQTADLQKAKEQIDQQLE